MSRDMMLQSKRALTWEGLLDACSAEACPDFAPDGQQVKGQHIWARRCGPQFLVPEHKAGRLWVSKHQVLRNASVHLQVRRSTLLSVLSMTVWQRCLNDCCTRTCHSKVLRYARTHLRHHKRQ